VLYIVIGSVHLRLELLQIILIIDLIMEEDGLQLTVIFKIKRLCWRNKCNSDKMQSGDSITIEGGTPVVRGSEISSDFSYKFLSN